MAENVCHVIGDNGDTMLDLHVWRVGPGHISAVVSVATGEAQRNPRFYHVALNRFKGLSHVKIDVNPNRGRLSDGGQICSHGSLDARASRLARDADSRIKRTY